MIPVALYFGPNLFIFGKLTARSISDYTAVIQREDVPVITAIKQYQRDTGGWPDRVEALQPKYLPPSRPKYLLWGIEIDGDRHRVDFIRTLDNEMLTYDLDPAHEGWTLEGHFYTGPVPLPPVKLQPVMHP